MRLVIMGNKLLKAAEIAFSQTGCGVINLSETVAKASSGSSAEVPACMCDYTQNPSGHKPARLTGCQRLHRGEQQTRHVVFYCRF